MPARRDLTEARQAVIDVTTDLIASEGLSSLSIRKVADRAGFSTSFVTHYFTSREDLILATYQAHATAASERTKRALSHPPEGDALLGILSALLPLDADRMLEWRIWTAFQGLTIGDARLTEQWRLRVRTALERIRGVVDDEKAAGRLPATVDPRLEAQRLLALVNGIAFLALLDPRAMPARQQRSLVADELARLRTAP